MISDDINKLKIKAKKEILPIVIYLIQPSMNQRNQWKVNVQPTCLRTLIGLTKTLNHGILPGITDFLKCDVQTMFLAQKKQLVNGYASKQEKLMGLSIPHVASLYLLLSGMQQYVSKVYSKMQFSLFADHEFNSFKNLCDFVFKKLHFKGIRAPLKTTAVLSADDEMKLWDINCPEPGNSCRTYICSFLLYWKQFACGVMLSSTILINYHSFREKLQQFRP